MSSSSSATAFPGGAAPKAPGQHSATAFPEGTAPKAPGQHSATAFPEGAAPKAPGRPDAPPSAIAGQTVVLRPTTPEHVPVFLEVLGPPEIAKGGGGYARERVRRELPGPHGFAVELAGEPIGLI